MLTSSWVLLLPCCFCSNACCIPLPIRKRRAERPRSKMSATEIVPQREQRGNRRRVKAQGARREYSSTEHTERTERSRKCTRGLSRMETDFEWPGAARQGRTCEERRRGIERAQEIDLVEDVPYIGSTGIPMTSVQRLVKELRGLSRNERKSLRRWFERFDAAAWDAEFEADAKRGRLDRLAERALREHGAGKSKALCSRV